MFVRCLLWLLLLFNEMMIMLYVKHKEEWNHEEGLLLMLALVCFAHTTFLGKKQDSDLYKSIRAETIASWPQTNTTTE